MNSVEVPSLLELSLSFEELLLHCIPGTVYDSLKELFRMRVSTEHARSLTAQDDAEERLLTQAIRPFVVDQGWHGINGITIEQDVRIYFIVANWLLRGVRARMGDFTPQVFIPYPDYSFFRTSPVVSEKRLFVMGSRRNTDMCCLYMSNAFTYDECNDIRDTLRGIATNIMGRRERKIRNGEWKACLRKCYAPWRVLPVDGIDPRVQLFKEMRDAYADRAGTATAVIVDGSC